MPRGTSVYPAAVVLPVVIVIAVTVVVTIVIAAWLVRDVARKAIDKTTPEGVAPVVAALGALLSPLRLFLPWSRAVDPGPPFADQVDPAHGRRLHNEIGGRAEGGRS